MPCLEPGGSSRDIPGSGSGISQGTSLFHDGTSASGTLSAGADGIAIRLGTFDGSYLSFAFDLPAAALPLLTGGRLFEAAAALDSTAPAAWLRVNLRHGSSVARAVSTLDPRGIRPRSTIDLAAFSNPASPSAAWAELIVDAAGPTEVSLSELVFWLSPRGRF